MSAKIGNDVKTIADLVEKLFKYERSFLLEASKCVQPSQVILIIIYNNEILILRIILKKAY
jgi:hypothetical protein